MHMLSSGTEEGEERKETIEEGADQQTQSLHFLQQRPMCFCSNHVEAENDNIYYNAEEFAKNPVACNQARCNRAYKYAAYIL
jgi:hypothetical protein